jgi:hypothetical protein
VRPEFHNILRETIGSVRIEACADQRLFQSCYSSCEVTSDFFCKAIAGFIERESPYETESSPGTKIVIHRFPRVIDGRTWFIPLERSKDTLDEPLVNMPEYLGRYRFFRPGKNDGGCPCQGQCAR